MRVLVTGSEGYIGRVLKRRLAAAGHAVVGLDTAWYRDRSEGTHPRIVPLIFADIRDVQMRRLVGFDAICHLAALSNDPLGELDADLTLEVNHRATVRLAEMARDAGVTRFLFSSSCSLYGRAEQDMVDESASFAPQTAYARSKVLAERDLATLARSGFSPIFLRNATAYGISPSQRFDLVLPNLVASAMANGRIVLNSDGSAWRPLVHVQDIASAFIAALAAPAEAVSARAFNVGRDEDNVRIRDLAAMIHAALPDCPVEIPATGAGADTRSYRVSFERIRRELPEFNPHWDVRRGIDECVAEFRKLNLTAEDLSGPRCSRVKHLRMLMESGRLGRDLRWPGAAPLFADDAQPATSAATARVGP